MKEKNIEGIVMKVTEEHIVLLTESGSFRNIPRGKNEVPLLGQHFQYNLRPQKIVNWKKYTLIAAVLLMTIISVSMMEIKSNPAYIIVVDINPSIEILVSRDLKIIKSRGLNSDGKEVIDSIVADNLNAYMSKIINKSIEKGYLDNEDLPLITTSVIPLGEHEEEILVDIKESVEESLKNNEKIADVEVAFDSKVHYEEANELGISVNYYKEYTDLIERGVVENIEETKGKSINQLKQMKNENSLKKRQEISPRNIPNNKSNKNGNKVPNIKNREENNGKKPISTKKKNSLVPRVDRILNREKIEGPSGLNIKNENRNGKNENRNGKN